jgi:hypothetical protein
MKSSPSTTFFFGRHVYLNVSLLIAVMLLAHQPTLVLGDEVGICSQGDPNCNDPGLGEHWSRDSRFTSTHAMTDFVVAGVNLGAPSSREVMSDELPFTRYQDFDLSNQITGKESWWAFMKYRLELDRPSLSCYVDKVARKSWLPSRLARLLLTRCPCSKTI